MYFVPHSNLFTPKRFLRITDLLINSLRITFKSISIRDHAIYYDVIVQICCKLWVNDKYSDNVNFKNSASTTIYCNKDMTCDKSFESMQRLNLRLKIISHIRQLDSAIKWNSLKRRRQEVNTWERKSKCVKFEVISELWLILHVKR